MKVKRITIKNFKGLKDLLVEAGCRNVTISGDNGTGKTTIYDAYTWCHKGHDSLGQSDFAVKPRGGLGVDKVSVKVEWVLGNGTEVSFAREMHEVWETKRGSSEKCFTGHETTYLFNDAVVAMKAYNEKVASVLGSMTMTNPVAFNSDTAKWDWKSRRAFLFSLCQIPSDLEVANSDPRWASVSSKLCDGLTLEDAAAMTKKSTKTLKDQRAMIPVRIDEAKRSIVPDNSESLKATKAELMSGIVQPQGDNPVVAELKSAIGAVQKNIFLHESKTRELSSVYNTRLNSLNEEAGGVKAWLESKPESHSKLAAQVSSEEETITLLEAEADRLRETFKAEAAVLFIFDSTEFSKCPVTGQFCNTISDRPEDIERAKKAFEDKRASRLNEINSKGSTVVNNIATRKQSVVSLKNKLAELDTEEASKRIKLNGLFNEIAAITSEMAREMGGRESGLSGLKSELESLTNRLTSADTTVANGVDYEAANSAIRAKVADIDAKLALISKNAEVLERVKQLEREELALSQQIANSEMLEDVFKEFTAHKCNMTSDAVNKMFKVASFEFFKTNINGNIEEVCECHVGGVPFKSVNTAARINAGIDIYNAVRERTGLAVPIWVDNAESVTALEPTDAQVFAIRVAAGRGLTVEVS